MNNNDTLLFPSFSIKHTGSLVTFEESSFPQVLCFRHDLVLNTNIKAIPIVTFSHDLSLADFDLVMFHGHLIDRFTIESFGFKHNARVWLVYAAQQQAFRVYRPARYNDLKEKKILYRIQKRIIVPRDFLVLPRRTRWSMIIGGSPAALKHA